MSKQVSIYDYRRYAILFVDDEAVTRKYFRRLFGEKFRILEAVDGVEALAVFRQHADEIGIIVTDQQMPNETGIGFLAKIADSYPDVVKILSTAYSDIDAAIGSVNQGGIFRYMTKPWDIPQLEATLRHAMEFFMVKRERDALLVEKTQPLGRILLSSRLAAFALVPVCAGIQCQRAAEAIASFVLACAGGRRSGSAQDLAVTSPAWGNLYAHQVVLAAGLEIQVPTALAKEGLTARAAALAHELESAGASEVSMAANAAATLLASSVDPTSALLDALLGRSDDAQVGQAAVRVLAAWMAIYDAGGLVRRICGEGLTLEITEFAPPAKSADPGAEVVKWLIDDDRLISAALGLR